jgi:hypothetical protein
MNKMRFPVLTGAILLITMPCTMGQSQDTVPGRQADPDIKWEVRKEYDEQGNLIYYDSACSHTWKHFDFPGPGEGWVFEDHPFAFGPFSEFWDSLDLDFYLDSSFLLEPQGFMPFNPLLFHSPDVFFDRHKDWMERFRKEFFLPEDSLYRFHPEWQALPRHQKKSARESEI